MDTLARSASLVSLGYNHNVAEALAENGYGSVDGTLVHFGDYESSDTGEHTAAVLSAEDAFRFYLEWNGIVGFAGQITDALDNCRNMEAL